MANAESTPQAGAGIPVQVCYAPPPPALPFLIDLQVAPGTTLAQALAASGLEVRLPALALHDCAFGIWGKLKAADTVLQARDRIEIYRPLIADPKLARRRRAEKKVAAGHARG